MSLLTIIFFIIVAGYFFINLIPLMLSRKFRKMQEQGRKRDNIENNTSRKKRIDKGAGEYVDYEEIDE
ncbi:MAG TPA: hypothetical protein PKY83_07190 [Bacteroidales bacterium]|jgi:hypothetical protein|nr:hypothetical protein [Bacteroidales bacterium]MCZ2417946.1 DUF4834 family protein [Burkholderiales bacterium]OQC57153.1 MAG: hypothetical protein BWX52_01180 [Bacteroidetes bacterium ADurb.Bin013]MBP8999197.1 hypothetical protein [Bacteroidales bacterium]MBV6456697.1 hypothetical protein [Bacteroidales bacterium]